MMLHIKYDCNWPTGFRDIHVSEIFMFQRYSCFMFESVKRHTDRRTQAHTEAGSSPNLYAHLVSSGELKSLNLRLRQHVCSVNVK